MVATPQARRNRLILVAGGLILVVGLLVLARGALFPFILSGALAYLLFPVVKALESLMPWRKRWPNLSRVVSILLIYVAAIAVLAGALAIIIPPTFRQAVEFVDEVPDLLGRARTTVEGWNEQYSSRVPEDVREVIEDKLNSASSVLISAARSVVGKTATTVTNAVTTIIGLAIVPFMIFYLLKDRETAVEGFYSVMPPDVQRHARNVVSITNQVFGAYIRAQLTLTVVVGTLVFVGLFLLGIRFSAVLGVIAGVTELVPVIGPLLGAIPGILVTLATSPNDLVPVLLLYVGIQLVENALLVPRIQGRAVEIHPAIIMVILVVASEAAGLWGVILAVPVAAVARDVFKYFYQEWTEASPLLDQQPSDDEPELVGDPPSEAEEPADAEMADS